MVYTIVAEQFGPGEQGRERLEEELERTQRSTPEGQEELREEWGETPEAQEGMQAAMNFFGPAAPEG